VRVGRRGRAPGQLDVTETCPGLAVDGVFHRRTLDAETDRRLEGDVVVPDPELVQLVGAVELELNPQRFIGIGDAEPHVLQVDRVLVVLVQAGAVDRVFGFRPDGIRAGGGRRHVGDGIGHRFAGEAPDRALEDRIVGRRVDLVDAPVVGLTQVESRRAGDRIVRRVGLALADQHAQRIGPAGGVDVVGGCAEVNIMCRRERARRPAQHDVTCHVDGLVGRDGVGGEFGLHPDALHDIVELGFAERPLVDADVVQHAAHRLGQAAVVAHAIDRVGIGVEVPGRVGGRDDLAVEVQTDLGAVVDAGHVVPTLGLDGSGRGHGERLCVALQRQPASSSPVRQDVQAIREVRAGVDRVVEHLGQDDLDDADVVEVDPGRQRDGAAGDIQRFRWSGLEIVIPSVDLNGAAQGAGDPLRAAVQRGVVAVSGRVGRHGAGSLVEPPPAYEARVCRPGDARQAQARDTGHKNCATKSLVHDNPPSQKFQDDDSCARVIRPMRTGRANASGCSGWPARTAGAAGCCVGLCHPRPIH